LFFSETKGKTRVSLFLFRRDLQKKFSKKIHLQKYLQKNKIFFKQLGTLVDVVTFTSGGCLKGRMVLFKKKIWGNLKTSEVEDCGNCGNCGNFTTTKKLQGL
jgi:hypothetical protein